jgi:hypothetical protein
LVHFTKLPIKWTDLIDEKMDRSVSPPYTGRKGRLDFDNKYLWKMEDILRDEERRKSAMKIPNLLEKMDSRLCH